MKKKTNVGFVTKVSIFMGALVILAVWPGQAEAQDSSDNVVAQKTYHAMSCQPLDQAGASAINRSEYRITNTGDESTTVLCPIEPFMQYWRNAQQMSMPQVVGTDENGLPIWDFDDVVVGYSSAATWGATLSVDVNVADYHYRDDISCRLMARDQFGEELQTDVDSTFSRPGNDVLALDVRMRPDATYLLKCRLPYNDKYGYTKMFSYTVKQTKDN